MSIQRIPRIQSLSLAVDYVGRAINCLSFYQPISTHQLAQMNMKAADLFCLLAEECNKHDLLGVDPGLSELLVPCC